MNKVKIFNKSIFVIIIFLFIHHHSFAQLSAATDSVIRSIIKKESVTELNNKGVEMMLNGNISGAGSFYDNAIKKDEGNKDAYYNRGIVSWVMNDTVAACRDWSAVLALGDTATFKLLDSKCHGSMIVGDEVIPKSKYRKIFSETDPRKLSAQSGAGVYVDEMPQYPGGQNALMEYLFKSVVVPEKAKQKNISGTVYINFIVSSKGKILFPYVIRGIGYGCDEEALRVIKKMPAWKPGKLKGKPVLVRYSLPVKFR